MTQEQAAGVFGVTPPMVSQYENGRARPGLDKLERFALETGHGMAWFFLEDGQRITQDEEPREVDPLEALEIVRRALILSAGQSPEGQVAGNAGGAPIQNPGRPPARQGKPARARVLESRPIPDQKFGRVSSSQPEPDASGAASHEPT